MFLEILYEDDYIIAVNKPPGILVHRTKIDFGEKESVVDSLEEQLGYRVFPVHRLDKPTSGVLILAKSSESAREMSEKFSDRKVQKKYLAVVRGIPPADVTIDHPITEDRDEMTDRRSKVPKPPQEAITHVKLLASVELPVKVDKYPTSRYSLVEAKPVTGRKHQIRRHLRHINHPIIGDINHGSGKHNRFFEERFKMRRLFLSCTEISFTHPVTQQEMSIKAPLNLEFSQVLKQLGLSLLQSQE